LILPDPRIWGIVASMAGHYIHANTNGRLHAADEPSVSPLNRGFLYGDAIYEVWRTYQGVLFGWEEHWARLERSARALFMALPFSRDDMLGEIRKTTEAYRQKVGGAHELYVRLQVSRGSGAIGLDPALADRAEFVLMVQPCPILSDKQLRQGQVLSVARSLRRNSVEALNPAWKTGNYLNNLLCLREAKSRGADEVVILNQAGQITEAAVCNLGFVRNGEILTPPLSAGILEGITRALVISEVASLAGLSVREETLTLADLPSMQECFLMSSTKDIAPVAAIDDLRYSVGEGSVTGKLKAAFGSYAASYAAKHPHLRV
jgi:branched-chain amino acid aminotransferase